MPFSSPSDTGEQFGRVRAPVKRSTGALRRWSSRPPRWCAAVGTTRRSPPGPTAIGHEVGELRANGLCGTPDEVVAKAATFAEMGAARLYLQVLDLHDLDHLDLLGEEVLPACASL